MRDVLVDRAGQVADPADTGTGGPVVVGDAGDDGPLDRGLDGVGQLVPAPAEQLDAVVGHRVVARRDHDAEVGVRRRAVRNASAGVGTTPTRSTSAPALVRPATTAASSISPLARGSRPTTATGREVPSRSARTPAAARATERASSGVRSALARPRTPSVPKRRPNEAAGQRLEYWGALRAFLSPYFFRSLTRGSRVRKPAFLRAGRSSISTSMRARAMARRSAPA